MSSATSSPIISDVGIVALVPDTWNSYWQVRHQVMSRLSRYFTVVWVDPPLYWREAVKVQNWSGRGMSHPLDTDGFVVYKPEAWRPYLHGPECLKGYFFRSRVNNARSILAKKGCKKFILYIWRPEFADALNVEGFNRRFYHIDDEYSFSEMEVQDSPEEALLISQVDQLIVHSKALFQRKARHNSNAMLVPNGVNYKAYAECTTEPDDLIKIPHPRIGYTGFLKKQLNWGLMEELVNLRPDWSYVFVGPLAPHMEVSSSIAGLRKCRNVYFLGGKPVEDLVAYPQHFDVCIMPYISDEYTRYIYPLKLHEYLASGRPVVGSKIPPLEDFSSFVSLVEYPREWISAIEKALSPLENTDDRRRIRQEEAERHDWGVLVRRIAESMGNNIDLTPRKYNTAD